MQIKQSAEDYLETMLILKEGKGYVRSVDIAEYLGVTKPSVSYATRNLRENGYITMASDGLITLTEKGMEIADRIYTRHKLLTEFFVRIGVDPDIAREDACQIEHDLHEETFDALCRYTGVEK
ncbi:MAG: metal-dependent transcriptional regulator [Bacillota bacterium]|nr:metal-dependent transcriptional regulator [Bacillota bacterium]